MRARSLGMRVVGSVVVATALAGAPLAQAPAASADCRACGRVVSIRTATASATWEPLGSAVGSAADVGGPAGSTQASAVSSFQIGRRNDGVVLLGSAGGAHYKKSSTSYDQRRWEVTVKLDDGGTRAVSLGYEPFVREGDRVRIAGNNVELLD